MPAAPRLSRTLLRPLHFGALVLLLLALLGQGAHAQPSPRAPATRPAPTADSARRAQGDTLRTDTAAAAAPGAMALGVLARDSIQVDTLASDSARRVADSLALAALADTSEASIKASFDGAAVALYGRTLFRVFDEVNGRSPRLRAETFARRLERFADDKALSVDSLRVAVGEAQSSLFVGSTLLFSLTDADAEGQALSRAALMARAAEQVRAEVLRVRERRTGSVRARSLALSAGAFGLWAVGLGLLVRLTRRAAGAVRRRAAARLDRIDRFDLVIGETAPATRLKLAGVFASAVWLAGVAFALAVTYALLTWVLGLFPATQALPPRLLAFALSPFQRIASGLVDGLPNLVALVVIALIGRALLRANRFLFDRIGRGELALRGFHADLAEPTRRLAGFLLVLLVVALAYPYTPIAGSRVLQGLTVFFGVLVSLGSSSVIGHVVSGLVITYSRSFRLGDRVKIGDVEGDVLERTLLVIRLRTPKNEIVALPSPLVLGTQVTNYSMLAEEGDGLIVHTTVTIGYDVPWPRVHALLVDAARRAEGFEAEPPPFVLQTALGDFSVAYQLNAYTRTPRRRPALVSELHRRVQDVFAEAGVEILSPTYHAVRDAPPTVPEAYDEARAAAPSDSVSPVPPMPPASVLPGPPDRQDPASDAPGSHPGAV